MSGELFPFEYFGTETYNAFSGESITTPVESCIGKIISSQEDGDVDTFSYLKKKFVEFFKGTDLEEKAYNLCNLITLLSPDSKLIKYVRLMDNLHKSNKANQV